MTSLVALLKIWRLLLASVAEQAGVSYRSHHQKQVFLWSGSYVMIIYDIKNATNPSNYKRQASN